MKSKPEYVIPRIVLKYHTKPRKNDPYAPIFKCAWCFEMSNRTGGGFTDAKGNPQQICETCAVWRYKDDHSFRTLAAARARRRRIFDVGYLFNEMILDLYMHENHVRDFKECKNVDEIFIRASGLYNVLFSKEEKIRLEEMERQSDIESELNKKLFVVDFQKFFSGL
jgi:hypothetical protein